MVHKLAIALVVLFSLTALSFSKVLYVSSNVGSDDNNGLSSTSPFQTIKMAEFKALHGDVIQLAKGVYQGSSNCIKFDTTNVTLVGPAKLQCNHGIRVDGINFHAINLTLPNVTISNADNVTMTNSKLTRGLSAHNVHRLNLTSVTFTRTSNISIFASDFACENCTAIGEGIVSVQRGGFDCISCYFPLMFVNASKPTSFIADNSTFTGISIYKLQTKKNPLKLSSLGVCNITSTNITCEESGFTGLSLYYSNCTVSNATIESCSLSSNSTNNNNGTAINLISSNSTFTNVTVQNNYGSSSIFVGDNSNFTMVNGSVTNNWGNETTNGTGIFISSESIAFVSNSTIEHNVGYHGAAFFLEDNARLFITNSSISHNTAVIAADFGCAVASGVSLKNCVLENNLSTSGVSTKCSVINK